MLTEKDPHIPSSERSTQNGDDIKNIDNNDGSDRYAVELKESIDTFDPEALEFNSNSEEIRKVRWKIDKRLIPLLTVMYLCSFLDRANIGNAKVAGMEADLSLKPGEFNTALSIFYVGYVIGEVPSNMALKQFGPRLWIPIVMFLWGSIMIAMAAGYAPGPVYVISMWYARNEQAIRVGLFFSASTVAGAFGGLLAYAISHMDGLHGLQGWQWIFIIEGIPTIVVCFLAFIYLPDFPATSTFLTPTERALTIKRLAVDAGPGDEPHFSWVQFRAAFKDWKVHMHMLIAILQGIPFASLGLFIPSIVQGQITTQIMTVPIYVVACFSVILFTYSSDRKKERGFHLAILSFMATIGYGLLVLTRHSATGARYVSLMICTSGIYGYVPVMLSWSGVNIGGHTKRGVAIALIISIAQIGSVIGGQLYRNDDERLTPEEYALESSGTDLADKHPSFRFYT
ncbi:MFS general substrate transporter [Linnemannia elongata AG-77]|uniref:MFS general substrate transporter n=1 Tax=Linnemannia elongata AG-77 TaxID=1314771 RepID=A0A197K7A9_9FUNG|nr:MFS general substrate transporter [Linnemannia elongata AG-77]